MVALSPLGPAKRISGIVRWSGHQDDILRGEAMLMCTLHQIHGARDDIIVWDILSNGLHGRRGGQL